MTLAEIMDRTRDQFLASARFAADENRRVSWGDHLDLAQDFLKSSTLTEDLSELEALLHLFLEVLLFAFELPAKPLHLFECAGVGDRDRSLICKQAQPGKFSLGKRSTAEDSDNPQ